MIFLFVGSAAIHYANAGRAPEAPEWRSAGVFPVLSSSARP
jgi:hypothetical protein